MVALGLTDADLPPRGSHPEPGVVSVGQLLTTWLTRDLIQVAQIVRVMTRHDAGAVGPRRAYLSILGPTAT